MSSIVSLQQGWTVSECGVSVVVCCHNSAQRIERTIEHLARLEGGVPWEVVLVDNASTDDTAAVARRTWEQQGVPRDQRIISEPRLGLSHARETGIAAARYEYVVLCDDDNWLDADYLRRAAAIMDAHPDVGVLGGYNAPVADVELPIWFGGWAAWYAVGAQALESGDITGRRLVWGAGMVLRRSAYLQIRHHGMESRLSDRHGTALSAGGDNEISLWFILAGYRLWYDESLRLRHFIPVNRLSPEYCRRLQDGAAAGAGQLSRYQFVLTGLEASNLRTRLFHTLAGLMRCCTGRQAGRVTAQAYNPLPGIVFDGETKRIQQVARALRRSRGVRPGST
jgi:glycosyltransferase involved in cell wall biosynthesis